MAIKNFLFYLKKSKRCLALITLCLSLTACGTDFFNRGSANGGFEDEANRPTQEQEPIEGPPAATAEPTENSFVGKKAPKLGIILGGGGVFTYAQIGVLQELVRQKIPIQAVVGLEWGSLVAATYSLNGKVHEVEWQLLKLPHQKLNATGVFGGKNSASVQSFNSFLSSLFQGKTFGSAKIPFACPYLDVGKNRTTLAHRGKLEQALKFCWPSMPEFRLSPQMANPMGYQIAQEFLKNQGAELILYVDVIGKNNLFARAKVKPDLASQLYWLQAQSSVEGIQRDGIDEVFSIPVTGVHYSDFSAMRSVIRIGQLKSRALIQEFSKKHGY